MEPSDLSWRTRFAAFSVNDVAFAAARPERAVVAAGGLEPHQVHAWDRDTGALRALTAAPHGLLSAAISADGEWVFYVDDPEQREEGVFVRVRWDGGEAAPLDPDLPPGFVWGVICEGGQVAF